MFRTLFFKECGQIFKSIIYYIFIACLVLFFVTQIAEFDIIVKPQEGMESYGFKSSDDEKVIMEQSLRKLIEEYDNNFYVTYPIGFYKQVILNEQKQEKMRGILTNLTGLTIDKIGKEELNIKPLNDLTYDEFSRYMDEANKLVGGGSKYSQKSIKQNVKVPISYEEAKEDYESILNNDRVSGAYARQFCDYMGIVLGILPVFLAVTRGLRDKRSKASEIIFSKQARSSIIILSRYLSTVVMILIPLLLLSISPTLQSLYFADSIGIKGDGFAFARYIFGWLLPIILFTTSIGFFFAELTDGPFGILVQVIWWIISIFMSNGNLIGSVGWSLVPRFNTVGKYEIYLSIFNELVVNRITYSIISIALIILTIRIYSWKRKGVTNIGGKILSNSKSESKV